MNEQCMHVKITATRKDLHDMGICSDATFDLLLSGKAFAVQRREQTSNGVMVYLINPQSSTHLLWVWEQFTERV